MHMHMHMHAHVGRPIQTHKHTQTQAHTQRAAGKSCPNSLFYELPNPLNMTYELPAFPLTFSWLELRRLPQIAFWFCFDQLVVVEQDGSLGHAP